MRIPCLTLAFGILTSCLAQSPTGPVLWFAPLAHTNQTADSEVDSIADDIFPLLIPRESTEFIMQGRIIPAARTTALWSGADGGVLSAEAFRTSTNVPAVDARVVLEQAGIKSVTNAAVMAWTPGLDGVIVTGQRSTNHVAVVAHRHLHSADRPWRLSFVQYKLTDRCLWIRGEKEYDHAPSQEDIEELLNRVRSRPDKFIFRESPRRCGLHAPGSRSTSETKWPRRMWNNSSAPANVPSRRMSGQQSASSVLTREVILRTLGSLSEELVEGLFEEGKV